ncbi:hypothetical protein B0H12DRAFT_1125184 [Mycena haematopus]|nr:hypothetical protein B0H12DRAFT_1125184 [Mycena haematopus]
MTLRLPAVFQVLISRVGRSINYRFLSSPGVLWLLCLSFKQSRIPETRICISTSQVDISHSASSCAR